LSQIRLGQVQERILAQACRIALAEHCHFDDPQREPLARSFRLAERLKVGSGYLKGPSGIVESGSKHSDRLRIECPVTICSSEMPFHATPTQGRKVP
jgi:hypothetical protein